MNQQQSTRPADSEPQGKADQPCRNMHEGVEIWEDTCVCEAEPRWQALAEEMEREEQEGRQQEPNSP